jgi:CHAT domain-containing protein
MTTGWTPRNFGAKNMKMQEYLMWLWETIVRPVLAKLEIKPRAPVEVKTKLHWIGVGPLGWAPFHAAGDHSPGSLENTMSYVISSYVPTLRSLAYVREQAAQGSGGLSRSPRMMLVTARETPGMAELEGIQEELDAVTSICDPALTVIHLENPNPDEVSKQLPPMNIVHFACHGVSSPLDPENSHLVLRGGSNSSSDGSETNETKHRQQLNVRRISARRSPTAELAYLSACSAAENRSAGLADETIYIATAFHLAGFRHVVATLWLAKDDVCPQVARAFYTALLRGSTSSGSARCVPERHRRYFGIYEEPLVEREPLIGREPPGVAHALHIAVDKPLLWAPFVHIGS